MTRNQRIGAILECAEGGEVREAGGDKVLWGLEFQSKMFKLRLVHLRRFQGMIRVAVGTQDSLKTGL